MIQEHEQKILSYKMGLGGGVSLLWTFFRQTFLVKKKYFSVNGQNFIKLSAKRGGRYLADIQGDQLNMAVFFWHFLQSTRTTRPCFNWSPCSPLFFMSSSSFRLFRMANTNKEDRDRTEKNGEQVQRYAIIVE